MQWINNKLDLYSYFDCCYFAASILAIKTTISNKLLIGGWLVRVHFSYFIITVDRLKAFTEDSQKGHHWLDTELSSIRCNFQNDNSRTIITLPSGGEILLTLIFFWNKKCLAFAILPYILWLLCALVSAKFNLMYTFRSDQMKMRKLVKIPAVKKLQNVYQFLQTIKVYTKGQSSNIFNHKNANSTTFTC